MDGSGLAFSNSTPELCPLDNRRSSKEVRMKLFAVHLTTLSMFCHALSLRRERIITWKLLAYLLEPASIFIAHVPGHVILTIATLYWVLFDRPCAYGRGLGRSIGLFSASRPLSEEPNGATELEPILKRCGRILLACAYLDQCCGTVGLFVRRANHDAVTRVIYALLKLPAQVF